MAALAASLSSSFSSWRARSLGGASLSLGARRRSAWRRVGEINGSRRLGSALNRGGARRRRRKHRSLGAWLSARGGSARASARLGASSQLIMAHRHRGIGGSAWQRHRVRVSARSCRRTAALGSRHRGGVISAARRRRIAHHRRLGASWLAAASAAARHRSAASSASRQRLGAAHRGGGGGVAAWRKRRGARSASRVLNGSAASRLIINRHSALAPRSSALGIGTRRSALIVISGGAHHGGVGGVIALQLIGIGVMAKARHRSSSAATRASARIIAASRSMSALGISAALGAAAALGSCRRRRENILSSLAHNQRRSCQLGLGGIGAVGIISRKRGGWHLIGWRS